MTPKFVPLDEAAEQLGIGKDTLNELREQGRLRAYKDGASWKFRSEDIDKMAAEGVPSLDSPSGLDLDLGDDLELEPLTLETDDDAGPTAADDDDDSESILLSEPEIGDSSRPPSTIIGKVDLESVISEDSDLKLKEDSVDVSDVRLADEVDLQLVDPADSNKPPSSSSFEDIDELELDLEAESSRVLAPGDVESAQKAAQAEQEKTETSDLRLEEDFELSPSSSAGLTGLSSLEVADSGEVQSSQIDIAGEEGPSSGPGLTGLSALELEEEDDFVLGDGSDITLSPADSGINLSPSDSGLSLDDPSLAGSAIGSALDLGSQIGGDSFAIGSDAGISDAGFELSPVSEADGEEDEEDSSQVIALDAFEESQQADDLLGGGEVALTPAAAAPATIGAAAAPQAEQAFSLGVVMWLGTSVLMLCVCGIMVFDIVRNMWSWREPYPISSSLIDGLTGLFF